MATRKKSGSKAGTAGAGKTKDSWASTIKQALQKKQNQGWPTEATNKSQARQSAAHGRKGGAHSPK